MDAQLAAQRERFLGYLTATFGDDVLQDMDEPVGVQVGERVLYRLTGGGTAARQEPSAQAIDQLRHQMTGVAEKTGASAVTFEPPKSSGLRYPRLVDLPGSSIVWDALAKRYRQSAEPLPAPDFPLDWVLGVVRASDDLFLYLDFTHRKVKALFTASYDVSAGLSREERARLRDGWRQFREQHRALRRRADANSRIVWAKIVQVDRDPVAIRIRQED